jgi:hypothetical protein
LPDILNAVETVVVVALLAAAVVTFQQVNLEHANMALYLFGIKQRNAPRVPYLQFMLFLTKDPVLDLRAFCYDSLCS